jgi:hypothetical protein
MNVFLLNNANLIICSFFLDFLFFEPIGLPRLWRALFLFATILVDRYIRISIRVGVFTTGI